jgi:hypothetical protein
MKHFKLLIIILSMIVTSCNTNSKKKNTEKLDDSISKIEVIDFHSTHRCFTCNTIEENTKHTLDTYFSNEMKENKITFQVINIDKEKNFALAEKFEATGTALFLNIINNGKEKAMDLTEFAFAKARNKDAFTKELKSKIETALKQL